jgi:ABC-type dipeptide/oligopeptide/nickel transport system permease subunit
VVVAVARLALGVLVGLVGGWFRGTTERVVDVVGSIGVGLPALVLAIALISFRG